MVAQHSAGAIRSDSINLSFLSTVPVAIRVYPVPSELRPRRRTRKPPRRPDAMMVWDTETRTDVTQRLTFGSYRFLANGECLREALFHADDLSRAEGRTLSKYAVTHSA